jgi:hypothetical protein
MGHRRNRFSSPKQHLSALRPRPYRHGKTIDVFLDNSYLTLKENKTLDLEIDIADFDTLLDSEKTKVTKTWPLRAPEH